MVFACVVAVVAFVRQYSDLNDDTVQSTLVPDQPDITYCTIEGISQKLDFYFPKTSGAQPVPLVVFVHGGSFTGGNKRGGTSLVTDIPVMVARGYAVASVNYRLAPQHRFPAPLADVKCSIRYLRANAAKFNIDPTKIAIWGASAGGNLAALVGLTGPSAEFDTGPLLDQSSRVSAVVDLFGPTDLTASDFNWLQSFLLYRAMGTTSQQDAILTAANPVNYVSKHAPPFLILHGEQDNAVPASQSRLFYERLKAANLDATLVMVKNANHEFKPTGGPIDPSRTVISQLVADFFDRVIR